MKKHPLPIGTVVVPNIDPSKVDVGVSYASGCAAFDRQCITKAMLKVASDRKARVITKVCLGGYELSDDESHCQWLPEWLSVVSPPWVPEEEESAVEASPYAGRVIITMDREIAEALATGIGALPASTFDKYYRQGVAYIGSHMWGSGLDALDRSSANYMLQDPEYPTIIDITNPNA